MRRRPLQPARLARGGRVRREVIQAAARSIAKTAGAFGIGQPEHLQSHGIDVVHELPGVGENLRDHFGPLMKYTINADGAHLQKLVADGSSFAKVPLHPFPQGLHRPIDGNGSGVHQDA